MMLYLSSATSLWMVSSDCLHASGEMIIHNEILLHPEQQWVFLLKLLMLINVTMRFDTASMWKHKYIEKSCHGAHFAKLPSELTLVISHFVKQLGFVQRPSELKSCILTVWWRTAAVAHGYNRFTMSRGWLWRGISKKCHLRGMQSFSGPAFATSSISWDNQAVQLLYGCLLFHAPECGTI